MEIHTHTQWRYTHTTEIHTHHGDTHTEMKENLVSDGLYSREMLIRFHIRQKYYFVGFSLIWWFYMCVCITLPLYDCTTKGEEDKADRERWKWTGLEFTKSERAVENREKWRKLVVKSSVVPQRPPRLRDR